MYLVKNRKGQLMKAYFRRNKLGGVWDFCAGTSLTLEDMVLVTEWLCDFSKALVLNENLDRLKEYLKELKIYVEPNRPWPLPPHSNPG
jgi:hypothetical protein